jgi:MFS family permease
MSHIRILVQRDRGALTVAFWAVVLAMLPGVLDQTILATALPTIASGLGRLADVSWVVTAYVVAAAAVAPLWGKLGDRLGRKRVLEASLVMFLAASAVCGVAQSLWMLVAARGVQGAAAGGLMSLAQAAVGDLVSPRERGRYQGYIMAVFAVAASVGPLLGGLLVDHVSWRWVFYVNLPIGALALAGLHLRLPTPEVHAQRTRLDLVGAGLLAAGTSALMLACIQAPTPGYSWGAPQIIALLSLAAVLTVALIARTRRLEDPIVPLSVIGNRPVALASAALFLVIAMMVGITLSTNVAGHLIQRTGHYKIFPLVGLALISAALLGLAALVEHPSRLTTGIALTLFGLGFGMVGQALIIAVQNSVQGRELGLAMAVTGFFRALGGAVGAAVLGAVFASHIGHTGTGTLALARAGRLDVISAVHTVFLVTAPVALLAFVIVLALKEVPLRGPAGPSRPDQRTRVEAGHPEPAGATR